LEFRVQIHAEVRQVHQFPAEKGPCACLTIVLEIHDAMVRVVENLVRFTFGFENVRSELSRQEAGAWRRCKPALANG